MALCSCSLRSVAVHFFKNFIKPFGDSRRAVRITDTLFFFSGLTGGIEVLILAKVLLTVAAAAPKNFLADVLLCPEEVAMEGGWVDDEAMD